MREIEAPTGREGPWARGHRGRRLSRPPCGGREQTLCRLYLAEITVNERLLHRRTPAGGGGKTEEPRLRVRVEGLTAAPGGRRKSSHRAPRSWRPRTDGEVARTRPRAEDRLCPQWQHLLRGQFWSSPRSWEYGRGRALARKIRGINRAGRKRGESVCFDCGCAAA